MIYNLCAVMNAQRGEWWNLSNPEIQAAVKVAKHLKSIPGGNKSFVIVGDRVIKKCKIGNFFPILKSGDFIVIPSDLLTASFRVMAAVSGVSITTVRKGQFTATLKIEVIR